MRYTRAARPVILAAALSLTVASAQAAPDARALVTSATSAMQKARSYQGTWLMTMSMGQIGSLSMSIDMKMVPAAGKFAVKMAPTGQATGQMAMGAPMVNMSMVSDGKTVYVYMPAMNGYSRQAADKRMLEAMSPSGMAMRGADKDADFKYVKADRLNGTPVHVVQVIPKGTRAKQLGNAKILVYIDQAATRVRQVTMNGTIQQGPNGPSQQMTMKMVVKREVLNQPVADSTFKFTPPPGAKELKSAGGPGVPGVPSPGR